MSKGSIDVAGDKKNSNSEASDRIDQGSKQGTDRTHIFSEIQSLWKEQSMSLKNSNPRMSASSAAELPKLSIEGLSEHSHAPSERAKGHHSDTQRTSSFQPSHEDSDARKTSEARVGKVRASADKTEEVVDTKVDPETKRTGITTDDGKGTRTTTVREKDGQLVGTRTEKRDAEGKMQKLDVTLYNPDGSVRASSHENAKGWSQFQRLQDGAKVYSSYDKTSSDHQTTLIDKDGNPEVSRTVHKDFSADEVRYDREKKQKTETHDDGKGHRQSVTEDADGHKISSYTEVAGKDKDGHDVRTRETRDGQDKVLSTSTATDTVDEKGSAITKVVTKAASGEESTSTRYGRDPMKDGVDDLTGSMTADARTVDYAKIFDGKRLMMLADGDHGSKLYAQETMKIIDQAKGVKPPITELGLELVEKSQQPQLDAYLKAREDSVAKHQGETGWNPDKDPKVMDARAAVAKGIAKSEDTQYTMDVIDKAVQSGMRVVGLEEDHSFADGKGWQVLAEGLEKLRTGDPALLKKYMDAKPGDASFDTTAKAMQDYLLKSQVSAGDTKTIMDTLETMKERGLQFSKISDKLKTSDDPKVAQKDFETALSQEIVAWRTRGMAETIKQELEKPDTRMLVTTGGGHLGYEKGTPEGPSIGDLMPADIKASQVVVALSGGDLDSTPDPSFPSGPDDYPSVKEQKAATRAGLSGDYFMLSGDQGKSRYADYYVHLPTKDPVYVPYFWEPASFE